MNLENDSEKPDFSPFLFFAKKADPVKGLWRARNRTRGLSTWVEIASKNGLKMRRDKMLVFWRFL